MSMFSREYKEQLIQKAIGLRVLEKKYSGQEGSTLTGFDPRFLELMNDSVDDMIRQGKTGRDFNEAHMGATIGRYVFGYATSENRNKLDKLAGDQTFRDMCVLLMMIMAKADEQSKLKDYR